MFSSDAAASRPLIDALNDEPEAGPAGRDGVWVLDWGTWAAAAQRHALMAMNAYDTHLENKVAVKARAREFREKMRTDFSTLRLFPLVAVALPGTPEEQQREVAAAINLARTRPELVTEWMWKCLAAKNGATPAAAQWFDPFIPKGTIYDVDHRPWAGPGQPRFSPRDIASLLREAPYSRSLVDAAVAGLGRNPSPAALEVLYGNLAAYDLQFAQQLAWLAQGDVPAYTERMEHVASLSPVLRYQLAAYLADHGRIPDAVRQYERWLQESGSEIWISNQVGWLLRHYHDTGQTEKATRLADRAGAVYSYAGLVARAHLHEWRGELAQAEEVLKKASERYDYSDDLLGFYLAHGRTGSEVDKAKAAVFPQGLTRIIVATQPARPPAGVLVAYAAESGRRNGLESGDVIVAVDGIIVRNRNQYDAMRAAGSKPAMQLIVWRKGGYQEITTDLRYSWLRSTLRDYTPPDRTGP
jgi:hypothetical protein